jgi:hypothetical protein
LLRDWLRLGLDRAVPAGYGLPSVDEKRMRFYRMLDEFF